MQGSLARADIAGVDDRIARLIQQPGRDIAFTIAHRLDEGIAIGLALRRHRARRKSKRRSGNRQNPFQSNSTHRCILRIEIANILAANP